MEALEDWEKEPQETAMWTGRGPAQAYGVYSHA